MAKNKKRLNLGIFISRLTMLVIVVALIYISLVNWLKPETDLYVLNYGTTSLTSDHTAMVIRADKVVTTLNAGVLDLMINDGTRVRRGETVAKLSVVEGVPSNEEDENPENQSFEVDLEALDIAINELFLAMAEALKEGRFLDAKLLKTDLTFKLDKRKRAQEGIDRNKYGIASFSEDQVGQTTAAAGQVVNIQSTVSGVVSFFVDGLESVLSIDNIYQIDYHKLFSTQVEQTSTIKGLYNKGDVLFKVVDNTVWYIACQVALNELDLYQENAPVKVRVNDQILNAKISELFASEETGVVLLKLDAQIPGMHNIRKLAVSIIREEVSGLFVPEDAVFTNNQKKGVWVLDVNQRTIFRPLRIITRAEGGYVVTDGRLTEVDENGNVMTVQTVRHGDTIVRNAQLYTEGQLIQ